MIYDLLFTASAETLITNAADPKQPGRRAHEIDPVTRPDMDAHFGTPSPTGSQSPKLPNVALIRQARQNPGLPLVIDECCQDCLLITSRSITAQRRQVFVQGFQTRRGNT